jgi:hypothetical protein
MVRETLFNLPNIWYAYGQDSLTVLVGYELIVFPTGSCRFSTHTFNLNGQRIAQTELLYVTLATNQAALGAAFDARDGELLIALFTGYSAPHPPNNQVHLIRYQWGEVSCNTFWDLGPIPSGSRIENPAATFLPGYGGLIGFEVANQTNREIRLRTFNEDGEPQDSVYALPLASTQDVNGLSLAENVETGYLTYTVTAAGWPAGNGAYAAGFHLRDASAANPAPAALPDRPDFSVFPNPFNARATVTYTLVRTTPVRLQLLNMLGQRVAVLAEGDESAGQHTVRFEAANLATGIYWLNLSAGQQSQAKKMLLLK